MESFAGRTFGSISEVLSDKRSTYKSEADKSMAERLYQSQLKQYQESTSIQKKFNFDVNFENIETDCIIKVSQ